MKLDPPYTDEDILAYLKQHQVGKMGDHGFDDCLFQSVLFTDFFEKIEAGTIEPGQRNAYDRPAQYLLKKSVELLMPLDEKIGAAHQRYKARLNSDDTPSSLRAQLQKKLWFVDGMAKRFESLKNDLLDAVAELHAFRPTRDKACFLLVAHAMLADAANAVTKWMDDLDAAKPEAKLCLLPQLARHLRLLVKSYVSNVDEVSNLFSTEPLTPADMSLYEKFLCHMSDDTDDETIKDIKKLPIPSFSPTGSQGVLAILHGIFHGKVLLTGADTPYAVHADAYKESHLGTLQHDGIHLLEMFANEVLSSTAPKLMPIYSKLENPAGNLAANVVKKDLLVLFYMLHEITEILKVFNAPSRSTSFVGCARRHFYHEFTVVDTVKLLKKVHVRFPAVDENSSPEEKAKLYEAVALAVNNLWQDFRKRHAIDLEKSGLFDKLPGFLKI